MSLLFVPCLHTHFLLRWCVPRYFRGVSPLGPLRLGGCGARGHWMASYWSCRGRGGGTGMCCLFPDFVGKEGPGRGWRIRGRGVGARLRRGDFGLRKELVGAGGSSYFSPPLAGAGGGGVPDCDLRATSSWLATTHSLSPCLIARSTR